MNEKPKKGIGKKVDKLLLGVIVGGAVGSILGLTLAPKSGKETRKNIAEKLNKSRKKVFEIVGKKKKSGGFWHFLNRIFCRQK